MNTTIANIVKEDIPEIIGLGLATPELHIDGDPQYYSEDSLQSFITSPHDIYLAAKVDGQLAGYFIATFNPYLKEAYLIDLVVKSEFRQHNIATELIAQTQVKLLEQGCHWVWCLVHGKNERMMEMLDKRGFKKGRQFQFFYKELD